MAAHKAFEILGNTLDHVSDFEARLVLQKGLIESAQHACANGSLIGSYDWVQDLLNDFEAFLCTDATRSISWADTYTGKPEVLDVLTKLYRVNRARRPVLESIEG